MSRSAKKGPFVDEKLFKKVSKLNENRAKQPIKTWARACTIVPEFVGLTFMVHTGKTHAKVLLVVRKERNGLRRYVHLATGNYNASTARIYEDFGLFTARDDIGNDVSELFNVLTGFASPAGYRKLIVAPRGMRERFLGMIRRELEQVRRTRGLHRDRRQRAPWLARRPSASRRSSARSSRPCRSPACGPCRRGRPNPARPGPCIGRRRS